MILPVDYCRVASLSDNSRKKTLVLGIADGCCAEIGVFLSHEHPATLEAKLMALGKPMFVITLENKMHVSLVARSRPFDRASLPSDEQTWALTPRAQILAGRTFRPAEQRAGRRKFGLWHL